MRTGLCAIFPQVATRGMPVTGVDLAEVRALAPRQWMRIGLGSLGLGLVLLGFTLRRK